MTINQETENLDRFAAGGWEREASAEIASDDRQQAADVLALFQQYITAARESHAAPGDSEEWELACVRMYEAEDAIVACSGTTALALKTFFIFRREHSTWAPEPYVRWRRTKTTHCLWLRCVTLPIWCPRSRNSRRRSSMKTPN